MAKFDNFLKNCWIFRYFWKNGPAKFFVPDLGGLLERFASIPTGLTLFDKIFVFKIENFGN